MHLSAPVANEATSAPGLTGSVHGGQQPIVGATVQLLAPGVTGYASAPQVLATATTMANGGFTLPTYTCPASPGLVYLTTTGGNTGSGPNSLASEAAVLGPCSSLGASTFIQVTEVTTVAAAYALAPFASVTTSGTAIGTTATNVVGLNNTFAVTNLLAPYSLGLATTTPGNMPGVLLPPSVLPQQLLNTLANILSSCINTSGVTTAGTTCANLLSYTTINGVAPVDTFQAAINMARQPGTNVSQLFSLSSANAPFQPALSSAPSTFNVEIGYAGNIPFSTNTPAAGSGALAIDASGNAFVLSATNLFRFNAAGTYSSTALANSCSGAGVAVSNAGNVYVSCGSNVVQEYASNGALLATLTATSLNSPTSLAFDAGGNLWVANSGSTGGLTEFTSAGVEAVGSPYATGSSVLDVAASPSAIWSARIPYNLVRVDNVTHAVLTFPQGVFLSSLALDHASNVWVASSTPQAAIYPNLQALELTDAGALVSPAMGYATGLVGNPFGIAIDGSGTVFVSGSSHAVTLPGFVAELTSTGTVLPNAITPVYTNLNYSPPLKPAADPSGNLWVSRTFGSGGYITLVVGAAAPVATPLATAVATNMLGVRP